MIAYPKQDGGFLITKKQHYERTLMPYGKWTCKDGRELLFDRDYVPICQRYPGKEAQPADPAERVQWYFDQCMAEINRLTTRGTQWPNQTSRPAILNS